MADFRFLARRLKPALTGIACAIAAGLCAPAFAQQSGRVPVEGAPAYLNDELARLLPNEAAPQTLFEARRQAERAADIVSRLMESEGYYLADVKQQATGVDTYTRSVKVDPGPLFTIASREISIDDGQLDTITANDLSPVLEPLAVGTPARAQPVLDVEDALVRTLKLSGYPDARANPVDALADGREHVMELTFHLSPGLRALFGEIDVYGVVRTNPRMIQRLAPWKPGEVYSEEKLEEFRSRLAETGLFESAAATLSPVAQPAPDGAPAQTVRVVDVDLVERERRTVAFGASASTSEGYGLDAEYEIRNWSGWGDSVTYTGRLASLDRRLSVAYRRPNIVDYGRNLRLSTEIRDQETDAYDQTGATVQATLEQIITPRLRGSVGLEAGYASIDDSRTRLLNAGRRDVWLLGGSVTAEYTGVRDILDPVDGVRARVAVEPGLTFGDTQIGYTRLSGEAGIYARLFGNDDLVGAVRGKVGSIIGPDGAPPDKLFFAGGGGSVRGYEYQSLSPRDLDNIPVGGRSLVETSLELRYRINNTFGAVAFLDAGAAGDDTSPPLDDMRMGAGLGLRYYAGFGPLRLDLAVPLNKRPTDAEFQVYISIGQAF